MNNARRNAQGKISAGYTPNVTEGKYMGRYNKDAPIKYF
jgi:hypothetical protein